MLYTDYQKVFELVADIIQEQKRILLLTDELNQELKSLDGTYLDDEDDYINILEVRSIVNSLEQQLSDAQSSFYTIANGLFVFGNNLKKESKKESD